MIISIINSGTGMPILIPVPVRWSDVHLLDDWHLNPQRILVPPIPASGRDRAVEISRRRSLPQDLLTDPAYALDSPH